MVRLLFVVLAVTAAAGCSASTSTEEHRQVQQSGVIAPVDARSVPTAIPAVPETPADNGIRRDLTFAISHDADLKDREISFTVANGDVNVTGIVHTEEERKRINDLAMSIGGVKSVANAVLIAE
jgi:osmotically-inducible protein OsmY